MGLHQLMSCPQVGASMGSERNRVWGQEYAILQGKWIPEILQGVISGRDSTLMFEATFAVVCVSFEGHTQLCSLGLP